MPKTCCMTASWRMSSLPLTTWRYGLPSVPMHVTTLGLLFPEASDTSVANS